MPSEQLFLTENMTFSAAFDTMIAANLDQNQMNTLIWGILGENLGASRHVFNYADTFVAEKPGCAVSFERSFSHTDWIDGESVVQAEETTIEEGFNTRFHRIEDDLDSLGAALEKVSGCCGDMRTELSARLGELRTEINRINTEIHGYHGSPQPSWPYYPMPINPPVLQPQPVPYPGYYPNPQPFPYPGGIDIDGPIVMQPWQGHVTPSPGHYYEATLAGLTQPVFEASMVMRSSNDPTIGTVAGLPARRLDIDEFNGTMHEVWSTSAGLVLTPAGEGVMQVDQVDRSWVNPTTKAVGDVAQWFGDNPKATKEIFADKEISVGALIERFGTDRLDGGATLESRLRSLPSGMKLQGPNDLIGALADRAVSTSKRQGVGMETLVANIGISSGAKNVADVSIESYKALPVTVRETLKENGVKTVGNFTDSAPGKIAEIFEKAGIQNATSNVARWQGEAQMVTKLGASLTGREV